MAYQDWGELDQVDRILLGVCAAVWLGALGAGVAATVALVELGQGHPDSASGSQTPWLLYAVIAISAAVIAGAVPLLLRARRASLAEPGRRPQAPLRAPGEQLAAPVGGVDAPTEQFRAIGAGSEPARPRPGEAAGVASRVSSGAPTTAVDQLWLRCVTVLAGAIGAATAAIGVATYLMAVDMSAAAWVCYGLAAVITVAMPTAPWFFLRELRSVVTRHAG